MSFPLLVKAIALKRAALLAVPLLIVTLSQAQYHYDAAGNMTKDESKGLDSIYYNHLDLMERVVMKDKGEVRYSYDALGTKLSKTVIDAHGTITSQTQYIDGIEYDQSGTLERIATEEGRVVPQGASFKYNYDIENYKGDVMVSFDQDGITQTTGYYPYGSIRPNSEWTRGVVKNKYLLTGKELQEETGFFDFGARMLDAVLGRWFNIDQLAEKYYSWSPYAYVKNNPIKFIDPDGRKVEAAGKEAQDNLRKTLPYQLDKFMQFNKQDVLDPVALEKGINNLPKGVPRENAEKLLAMAKNKKQTFRLLTVDKTDEIKFHMRHFDYALPEHLMGPTAGARNSHDAVIKSRDKVFRVCVEALSSGYPEGEDEPIKITANVFIGFGSIMNKLSLETDPEKKLELYSNRHGDFIPAKGGGVFYGYKEQNPIIRDAQVKAETETDKNLIARREQEQKKQ